MASFNRVFLLGNLTRDPELRHTPGGSPVASFGLATSRTYTSGNGEKKEDAMFITVIVWGDAARSCAQYLTKGRQVLIEGRLQYRTWDDRDGGKRSVHEVVADRVQFLGPRPAGSPSPDAEEVPF
jgi:single-strand DNA-binding protein